MKSPLLLLSFLFACRTSDKVDDGDIIDTGSTESPDADADGYDADEDCDDANSVVNPGAEEICDGIDNNCDGTADEGVTSTYYADTDGDGFGDDGAPIESCEVPDGYAVVGGDCDDATDEVYPSAPERCDEVDNDCDGEVDEDVLSTWYADGDGDGFGDPDAAEETCDPEQGYVSDATDCDDTNATTFPGGTEVCDAADNDCDGTTDEDVTTTYYEDVDSDGYGVADTTTESCDLPTGYAETTGDCDDADAAISPDADEVCDDVDNNCDGTIDEDAALDALTWYADDDGDGYGDATDTTTACDQPSSTVADDTDCNDAEADANPGAAEVCDSIDNDCDGTIDEDDATDALTWYADDDGDGYGDAADTSVACDQPSGAVSDSTDCDDAESSANPGETEVCDSIDNDCDGDLDEGVTTTYYADSDGDGFGDADSTTEDCTLPSGYLTDATDCDDTDSAINPDGTEVCDGDDNDCDGTIDEDDATDAATWYADDDGDGYGDATDTSVACDQPSGAVADATDCDDTESAANPGESEVCDEIDNNCDGTTDEGVTTTLYADSDGDGYGDADSTTEACEEGGGYLLDSTDCDDTDAGINPGESEVYYDGIDADCDGTSDYDADADGDDSEDYGGGDCDDTDPTAYEGVNCRPEVTCTHPSATTLATYDPSGVSDIVFNDDCDAVVTTLIGGTDYVYTIDSAGSSSYIAGYSNYNIQSIALDPLTGDMVISHNNNSSAGIGYSSGSTFTNLVSSSYNNGSLWSNTYMNRSSGSLSWDTSGCIWAPGFGGSGTLSCVETDGSSTEIISSGSHIESVALDSDEDLYIAIGDTVYLTDTSTGATTTYFTAADDILDMVFDYNDDLYVENNSGEIELVPGDGSSDSTFDTVSGQGRLAISPDGSLIRVIPAPTGAASYEEWSLAL
ncbi:MAG: hypothetical protein ACI8RZ_002763 [Myxococcota bacterium]|jgi:hypothetical protein